MGLLDLILGRDESHHWGPQRVEQVVDFTARPAVSGVALGASLRALQPLGRPSNRRPIASFRFVYADAGLVIETEQDVVSDFEILLGPLEGESERRPAHYVIRFPGGQSLTADESTTIDQFARFLGEPESIDTDEEDEETIATFTRHDHSLQLEAGLDGRVKNLIITGEM